MIIKVHFNAIGKFKDSSGSRPIVFSVSSRETKDKYSELPVSGMGMEERLELLQRMAIETFKEGFRAGGGGKYIDVDKDIVIENGKIVVKNIEDPDIRTNVSISTKGLTPYQIGKLTAENKIRGNDSDPRMRNKVFKHKVWDDDNIRRWVEHVKLPQNPVEWQSVNRLHGDDRKREINKIVNAVIFSQGGIYDQNRMTKKENIKYESAINKAREFYYK